MIASILKLSRSDIKALNITDDYSLHRVVYSLFEDKRSEHEKHTNVPSGFLFADKGGDAKGRKILILSDREPLKPDYGFLESKPVPDAFLKFQTYRFEVTLNPTRKENKSKRRIPLRTREDITAWALAKANKTWGFSIDPDSLNVRILPVKQFAKKGHKVTHGAATLSGVLHVEDRERFIKSFRQGIGRGRAFGFGLLQLAPIQTFPNN